MPKFYLTTSIAYVNARPHVGYAMELVQGDALCRYRRLVGDDVHFLTGTDEHGLKMAQTAKEQNTTPQELADKNAAAFRELTHVLNISNDGFIRTTDALHIAGAQKLWQKLVDAGALYKKNYEGLYCVGCEAYITEKDLVNGLCPTHQKPPVTFKEENYFFAYSKYMPEIKKLIAEGTLRIVPESRKNEMLGMLEVGMEEAKDISFSRPSESLSWGIPVPNDESQRMYVWCDALSNYITALDYKNEGDLFTRFWPADVHLIGKDILRFHAGVWIAMLLAAEIKLPKAIYVHGYITSEGQKMSKSLGNVVDPFEIVTKFGVESLRYYLIREIPTTDDGDFSMERFHAVYDGELANNLGNLVSRVLTMTEKYSDGKVPPSSRDDAIANEVLTAWKNYQQHMDAFNLKAALETVFVFLTYANQYIDTKKPWSLAKTNPTEVLKILYHLLELIRHASLMLTPFLPATAAAIHEALNYQCVKLYPDGITWGILKEGTTLKKPGILFPRREVTATK